MAATFFLPAIRDCDHDRSALHYVANGEVGLKLLVLPPFLFAGVFAALTLLALKRREMTRQTRRLGLGALALFAILTLATSPIMEGGGTKSLPWIAAACAGVAGAAALVRTARGRKPWAIWERLLAGFALIAAGCGPTIALVIFHDGVLWGGWLYLSSLAALLIITLTRTARAHAL